jgi:hypothetical protein
MSTPAGILGSFAAIMILVAEVSAGQLVIARAWTRRDIGGADIAVSRLLAGIAVAGLLVPGLSILPNAAWEVAFAVMTAWLAWRLWLESRGRGAAMARGHYAAPLVQSAAMLYIFAALGAQSVSSTGGMAGMAGWSSGGLPALHAPTLALIFALLLVAFAVHDLDRRAGVDGYFRTVGRPVVPARSALAAAATGPAAYTAERLLLSPAVVKGCQVTIGVTTAFLLIIMI